MTQENKPLIERKDIEGTPFTMIRQEIVEDKAEYFIVMGSHRLTEPKLTEDECLELLVKDYWKIVVNVIAIITETYYKLNQEEHEMA